jgi:putative two-component system response regulator
LKSRTEIGELATTFNFMSEELEQFIEDLKRAATENRELFLGSIQMLAGAVDEKDPYTRGHSDRVTRYSVMIAREMGQPEEFLETIRISAQLHDVGKIGIEDRILKKPGALTPEEFEIMKTHTTIGREAIAAAERLIEGPSTFLRLAREIAHYHQEKWDGSGYPEGLRGDAIPLSARLMALADVYDALISRRVYKPPFPHEKALDIIREGSGKHFDPDIVEAFLRIEREFRAIAEEFADTEAEVRAKARMIA